MLLRVSRLVRCFSSKAEKPAALSAWHDALRTSPPITACDGKQAIIDAVSRVSAKQLTTPTLQAAVLGRSSALPMYAHFLMDHILPEELRHKEPGVTAAEAGLKRVTALNLNVKNPAESKRVLESYACAVSDAGHMALANYLVLKFIEHVRLTNPKGWLIEQYISTVESKGVIGPFIYETEERLDDRMRFKTTFSYAEWLRIEDPGSYGSMTIYAEGRQKKESEALAAAALITEKFRDACFSWNVYCSTPPSAAFCADLPVRRGHYLEAACGVATPPI